MSGSISRQEYGTGVGAGAGSGSDNGGGGSGHSSAGTDAYIHEPHNHIGKETTRVVQDDVGSGHEYEDPVHTVENSKARRRTV